MTKIKDRFHMTYLVIAGLVIYTALIFTPAVWAGDWHELRDLDSGQLSEKILEYEKVLEQNPSDYNTIKGLGIAYHTKAQKDAKKFAPKAVEFLSKAHEINKNDKEAMCYLGSATTMMGKTTWNPIKKTSYVNKGIALMDKAVELDPDNVSVRMTRAMNSIRLPSMFSRRDIAVEDLEHLVDIFEKKPESYASIKKEVYHNLAELYSKADEQDKAEKFRRLAENQ